MKQNNIYRLIYFTKRLIIHDMIQLRDYQNSVISTIKDTLHSTKKDLIVLPTGSGKTVIFANLLPLLPKPILIVAHTKELISQAESTIKKINPFLNSKDFKIWTVQKSIRNKSILPEFKTLIIDECHRSCSNSYRELIKIINPLKLLGFTATPFRLDRQNLTEIFGHPTIVMNLIDMIEQGYLVDFKGYRIKTKISLKGIKKKNNDFDASKLSSVINVKERNELIVKSFLEICPNSKSIVFCASINHANEISKEFKKYGISSTSISGQDPNSTRKSIIKSLKEGKIQVITNCSLLTEGFDEPSLDSVLICRPTMSKTLYIQMIGRGSRLYDGKDHCKIIEFTDNDYDVCCIEDIFSDRSKKTRIFNGQSMKEYSRKEKELEESDTKQIEIEKMSIIKNKKTIFEIMASEWQKEVLYKNNIIFNENITEFEANILIKEIYG